MLTIAHQEELHAAPPVVRWMYVGDDTRRRVELQRGVLAEVEYVALGERIQQKAQELRRPYIDWIGELSVANDSVEWWASELPAKNPTHELFTRLCSLAASRDAWLSLPDEPTLAVCSTPAVCDALEAVAKAAGRPAERLGPLKRVEPRGRPGARVSAARRLVATRGGIALARGLARTSHRIAELLDRSPRYRGRIAGDDGGRSFEGPGTVLCVTYADEDSVDAGSSYIDQHFGPLAELLRARGLDVAFLVRVLPGAPFEETVRRLRATGERMFFADAYVEESDWRWCTQTAGSFNPSVPDDAEVGGVPLSGLAREQHDRLRSSFEYALSYSPLVRNLAYRGIRPTHVIYSFEGQSWENTFVRAAREQWPGAHLAGYDNLNFTRQALCLYPARSELEVRPLPDRVVTNGPAFSRVLIAEGFPAEKTVSGCALRHASVPRTTVPRAASTPIRVLATPSLYPGQAVELIDKSRQAFAGRADFRLVIRPHPLTQAGLRAEMEAVGRGVEFSDSSLVDLLDQADVLLYTYSFVCFDALMRGVPPLFVESDSSLDLDQLDNWPDLRAAARTPDQLRSAVRAIASRSNEERETWLERANAVLAEALAPIGPDSVEAFLRPRD